MKTEDLEYWLQGPVPEVPPLLQPVAHALLQARKEINDLMYGFPDDRLWLQPAGAASPAFHLQHITGVLNRLFTYADGKALNSGQLFYLSGEGKHDESITLLMLMNNMNQQVDDSISFLKQITIDTLTETRYVGRAKILSTQLGLLFHAAEHTMRHNGQLQVTVKVILESRS